MSQALFVSQLANRVNSLGKLDAKNGLFNWPLDDLAKEILPPGTILIWSGVVADIPKGWQLCDGTNGTPDLRARFVMGGGGTVNIGSTGGSLNYNLTLTASNLPAHTHSITGLTTDVGGSHTHSITDPGHSHNPVRGGSPWDGPVEAAAMPSTGDGRYNHPDGNLDGSRYVTGYDRNTIPLIISSSSTGISIGSASGHTHTLPNSTTGSTGTGTAVTIPTAPPYYSLCYIMRLPYSGSNSLEYGPSAPGLGGSGEGDVDQWTVETAAGGLLLRITAQDLTYKDIKLTAGNDIELVKVNDGELVINSKVNVDFEGSWSAKRTTDLPEVSPARYWTPTRETALTTYIDENDYLNFYPTAGILKENRVPIYADFKFSIAGQQMPVFWLTDNQNFDTVIYNVMLPYGLFRPYRGYRFSYATDFIYETEPLDVNFRTSDEFLMHVSNMGTYFAYVALGNTAVPSARKYWLVKTFASGNSLEWQAYADVTSLAGYTNNLFLMLDPAGDRILQLVHTNMTAEFVLNVYDNSLALLRSITLLTASEVDMTGLVNPTNVRIYEYPLHDRWAGLNSPYFSTPNGIGGPFPFTWNKYTEELLVVSNMYLYREGTPRVLLPRVVTISWQVPKQWLINGAGPGPSNNISDKGGGKRYILNDDNQTNIEDSGISSGQYYGNDTTMSVVTDEYARRITLNRMSRHTSASFDSYQFNVNTRIKSFNATAVIKEKLPSYKLTLIPDASAWSKIVNGYNWHMMGNNIGFSAYSNTYGWKFVTVDVFTNKFETRPPNNPAVVDTNNTLYLDPTTSKFIPDITHVAPLEPAYYTTTVIAGVPYYYRIRMGLPLQTISLNMTATGNQRVFTDTSFTLPNIPTTIGSVSGIKYNVYPIVFEGNLSSPVFWAYVKGFGVEADQLFIAKFSGGGWNNIYGPYHQDQLDLSNTAWNDRGNTWIDGRDGRLWTGTTILTESKKILVHLSARFPSGAHFWISNFDTTAPGTAPIAEDRCKFNLSANNSYRSSGECNGYHGTSFGYSTAFGYYAAVGNYSNLVTCIRSSKNFKDTSATVYTENEWYTDEAKRYEINFSAEATTGLFVYMRNFPIFVGGYYGQIPNTTISVPASTTSWIYARKPDAVVDRRNTTLEVRDEFQPSSFREVNLGSVTTLADKITASEAFTINPETWEPDTGLTTTRTFTFVGKRAAGNQGTFDLCVVRGLTVNGTIELAINFAASGTGDKGSYQRAVFAVGTFVNSGSTGFYSVDVGTPVNRTVTGTPFTYTRISAEAFKISWNGAGLTSADTNFALYLRINSNMFLTINRLNLDG